MDHAGGFVNRKHDERENRQDQDERDGQCGDECGGVAVADAALKALVNGIEDDDQDAGPSERREKRRKDAVDEISEQGDDGVEEDVVKAAARGVGVGHGGVSVGRAIVIRARALWALRRKNGRAVVGSARVAAMTEDKVPCKHLRTQLVAQDSDATYVECLDCGAILEGEELEQQKKKDGFNETLSDA